jgi:hypothetical protein
MSNHGHNGDNGDNGIGRLNPMGKQHGVPSL